MLRPDLQQQTVFMLHITRKNLSAGRHTADNTDGLQRGEGHLAWLCDLPPCLG